MRATLVICRDPFIPSAHRTVASVSRRRRISALAPKGAPVICNLNGKWLPRAAWRRRVIDGDLLQFMVLPQGGGGQGGSDTNSILRMIAIAVISWFTVGGGAAGAGGWASGTSFATAGGGLTGTGMMIGGAMFVAGAALVNTLIPPPKPASMDAANGNSLASSSTYNLAAQGNQARIGQPVPTLYGRNMRYPDFAAMPYMEYVGNEQYLYQLLLLGQGEYDIEAIRIEDTPISSFDDVTYEIVPPGSSVTLFPTSVVTSVEVSGQEALYGSALGPFVATAAGITANVLAIDVVFPRGMFYADQNGGINIHQVNWIVEAQQIDDSGTPVGAWTLLGNETYWAATTTPQRMSYRYGVPPGRYQARLTRTSVKSDDTRVGNDLNWAGLRAYVPGAQNYGNVTVIAMRMKASNSLSMQASRKVNVIATRKLKTWSQSTGWSATTVATRNPAWALADICANTDYGAGLADSRIGLAGLAALAVTADARGDTCDIIFDAQTTIMESLTTVARTVRALPFIQGGIVQVVRDEAQTTPVAMFSQRNIVRGSLKMHYLMPSESTADCIEVTYWDSTVWGWRQVTAALPGSSQEKPYKVTLAGISARHNAWREGMYMAANNRYRRRLLTLRTEMEGFIPTLGDMVVVQHDVPKWGQSGEIVSWSAATKTAIVSEPLDWSAGGAHSLSFRKRDGSESGPYSVTIGMDAYHVVLTDWDGAGSPPDPTPDTGYDRERAHFAFGPSNTQYVRCRVLGMAPKSMETAELSLVVESDYVHTADTGASPGDSAWQLPSKFTAPVVTGLLAVAMPDDPSKMLISWKPAPGADRYLVEQSAGDGKWTRVGEVSSCNLSAVALYLAQTVVRVAAIGMTRGPWVEVYYGLAAGYMWTTDSATWWSSDSNNFWSV